MGVMSTERILKNIDTLASSSTWTSDTFDLTDKLDARVHIDFDNNGNTPTTLAKAEIEISPNDSDWFPLSSPMRGPATTAEMKTSVYIPHWVAYFRVKITSGSHSINIQKVTVTWRRSS